MFLLRLVSLFFVFLTQGIKSRRQTWILIITRSSSKATQILTAIPCWEAWSCPTGGVNSSTGWVGLGLKGCGVAILLLRVCGTGILGVCGILLLRVCGIGILKGCGILLLRVCGIGILRVCGILLLRVCGIGILRVCGILLLRDCGIVIIRDCGIFILLRGCGKAGLLLRVCGILLLRDC